MIRIRMKHLRKMKKGAIFLRHFTDEDDGEQYPDAEVVGDIADGIDLAEESGLTSMQDKRVVWYRCCESSEWFWSSGDVYFIGKGSWREMYILTEEEKEKMKVMVAM